LWAFEKPANPEDEWTAKFSQEVSEETKEVVQELIDAIEEHDDVSAIYTNVSL
jgi:transcriptional/translational regulatory protein YebC/TACO1